MSEKKPTTPRKQAAKKAKYNKIEDIFRLNSNRIIIKKELSDNISAFKPDDVAKFILEFKAKSEDLEKKVSDMEDEIIELQEEIEELNDA
jgi:cell division septum initiation protein DivIVA